jgi:hypothetical protein
MPVTARLVLTGAAAGGAVLTSCCKETAGAVMWRALDAAKDDAGNLLPMNDAKAAIEGKSNT